MTHEELDEVKALARQRIGRGDLAAAVDGLLVQGRAEALEAVLEILSVEGLLTGRIHRAIARVQASLQESKSHGQTQFVRKRIQIKVRDVRLGYDVVLEIDALVLGVWAAHYALDFGDIPSVGDWVITHAPTGFRVPEGIFSAPKAAELARALYKAYPNWYEHLKCGESRRGEAEWKELGGWFGKRR